MSTKGINQDAFSGDTPPPQKSLIPKSMLNGGVQGQDYGTLSPMQQVIGLTPEQAKFRLQQQELTLKQQELNQQFLFRMLATVGSIAGAVILGAIAIFQLSPSNRANAYAHIAERTAESIGRPEIRVDCGFRLMGECDAGQMADRALAAYQPSQPHTSSTTHQPVQVPLEPLPEALGNAIAVAVQPSKAVAVSDPRQSKDYQQAYQTIHQWSRAGHGSEVIAGHYYWLRNAQSHASSSEHAQALEQPNHHAFRLAFEDYYNLSI